MTPLALSMPGPFELILLTGLGLLFFGRRLPEVGKSIGQTIVQFKKGLNDVGEQVTKDDANLPDQSAKPKFDAQTGKLLEQ
jgi:sec-independent protein translocase protein TatA